MAKLKIKELKYIVMEGGGARGTAYLGAVRALENQLKELVESDTCNYQKAVITGRKHGIMDYLAKDDNGKYVPIIKGVSGSSAGAITTFAITLGLNSEEIEEVLNFEFKNFLSEIDPGKYRMIGNDSSLKVGRDKGDVLGANAESFAYDLNKDKTEIKQDGLLKVERKFIFNMIIKVVGDGLISNINQLLKFFSSFKVVSNFTSDIQKYITQNSKIGESAANVATQATKYAASKVLYSMLSKFVFSKMSKKFGMTLKEESVITLFADNGVFSGFQVREFFYDLLLYAATRDTYFQKEMLKYYSSNKFNGKDLDKLFKENSDCFKDFKIQNRSKTFKKNIDFGKETDEIFKHLQDLSFQEFWEITKIEFAVGVSNYSAGKPLYFSDIYTPHFRVLEAVAASMNIPPIKPILNTSNVIIGSRIKDEGYKVSDKFGKNTIDIDKVDFNDEKVDLSENIDAYNFYEHIVKLCLREELLKDIELENPYVDVNNNIDLQTFLPKLMQLVIGDKYGDDKKPKEKREVGDRKIKKVFFDGYNYDITDKVLKFYYNAQFKGLLIDGGYYNNIPYNYFRDCILKNLDGVLAIKLDNSFPADLISSLNKNHSNSFIQIIKLEKLIDDDLYSQSSNPKVNAEYEKLITSVRLDLYENYLIDSDITQKSLDRNAILKLMEQMVKAYKNNKSTIWLKKKSILSIALEGYSFGAERGQVREIGDNNHIIPLYSYGVDTFDFDMKKVKPMAKMAQTMAEKGVKNYFKDDNQQKATK